MRIKNINKELSETIVLEINKLGLRKRFVADKLGITVNSLRRKCKNEISWTNKDIDILNELFNKKLYFKEK